MSNTDKGNVMDACSIELTTSINQDLDDSVLARFYSDRHLKPAMVATLEYINRRIQDKLTLPYFADIDEALWLDKAKSLDIYITDKTEGCEINRQARGKDYATNILSYPSEMPANIIELMPTIPLGELIICHEVVADEAAEQNKSLAHHISHLVVHGILHLLGFDHEIGQAQQDEMERFEVEILARLGVPNPYL